ncbi:MAG: Na+/H+ antiporter NhaA [Polyangiaceae bacterium]
MTIGTLISFRPSAPPSVPPDTWAAANRAARRFARPLSHYLHVEATSGVVLLLAAAAALIWANSPWRASYEHLWHTPIGISIAGWSFSHPLHFWINDVLMVLFFFVAGMEIRREIHEGELSEIQRAALPAVAALGGMLAPAAIYALIARGSAVSGGWGVPMATDIAFAVGIFALLGKRVPAGLRVLLLALAIIDDIGAIIVIALFFSSDFAASGLLIAAAGIGAIITLQRLGVRRSLAFVPPAVVVWAGMYTAGVHPTIAGVIVGMLTPVRSWYGQRGFASVARRAIDDFSARVRSQASMQELMGPLSQIESAQREALPPVSRLSAVLHPWVAFGIMPLFALANAGVDLSTVNLAYPAAGLVAWGVALGLFLGKPLGIVAACWLSVKAGVCSLPRGVDFRGIFVVGLAAGIGFTMAIFIAGLAFPDAGHLGMAKLAVLVGSGGAGVIALLAGRFFLKPSPELAHVCVDQAERSTEY